MQVCMGVGPFFYLQFLVPSATLPAKGIRVSMILLGIDRPTYVGVIRRVCLPNTHQSYARPPTVSHESPRRVPECGNRVLSNSGMKYKRIVPVFYHASREPRCEHMCVRV